MIQSASPGRSSRCSLARATTSSTVLRSPSSTICRMRTESGSGLGSGCAAATSTGIFSGAPSWISKRDSLVCHNAPPPGACTSRSTKARSCGSSRSTNLPLPSVRVSASSRSPTRASTGYPSRLAASSSGRASSLPSRVVRAIGLPGLPMPRSPCATRLGEAGRGSQAELRHGLSRPRNLRRPASLTVVRLNTRVERYGEPLCAGRCLATAGARLPRPLSTKGTSAGQVKPPSRRRWLRLTTETE